MHKAQVYYDLEKLEIIKREYLSKDEQKDLSIISKEDYPEDVFWERYTNKLWRYPKVPDDGKIKMLLDTTNAVNIRTIKYFVIFFTVLLAIALCAGVLAFIFFFNYFFSCV